MSANLENDAVSLRLAHLKSLGFQFFKRSVSGPGDARSGSVIEVQFKEDLADGVLVIKSRALFTDRTAAAAGAEMMWRKTRTSGAPTEPERQAEGRPAVYFYGSIPGFSEPGPEIAGGTARAADRWGSAGDTGRHRATLEAVRAQSEGSLGAMRLKIEELTYALAVARRDFEVVAREHGGLRPSARATPDRG